MTAPFATISKRFHFDAAHWLTNVPEGHKCGRMHGHSYKVEIVLRGRIKNGFVVDYADIATAWGPLFDQLDHRTLNDVEGLKVPSTEHLVHWMIVRLLQPLDAVSYALHSVRVFESETTWCEMTVQDLMGCSLEEMTGPQR